MKIKILPIFLILLLLLSVSSCNNVFLKNTETTLADTDMDNETTTPEDSETTTPEDVETTTPEDTETTTPENIDTTVPDDTDTTVPSDTDTTLSDDSDHTDGPVELLASDFYIGMKYGEMYRLLLTQSDDPVEYMNYFFFTDADNRSVVLYCDEETHKLQRISIFAMPETPPAWDEYRKMESGTPIYEVVEKFGTPIGITGSGNTWLKFLCTDENGETQKFNVQVATNRGELISYRFPYSENAIHPSKRLSASDMQIGMSKDDFNRIVSKTGYISYTATRYGVEYVRNYFEYGNYIFFYDAENNNVVLHFDNDFILDRVEKYAPVDSFVAAPEVLQVGMSIYEVVEKAGMPYHFPDEENMYVFSIGGIHILLDWDGAAMEDMRIEAFVDD